MLADHPGRACSHCQQWKPWSEFYREQRKHCGHQPLCKTCANARRLQWERTTEAGIAAKRHRITRTNAKRKTDSGRAHLRELKRLRQRSHAAVLRDRKKVAKYRAMYPEKEKAKRALAAAVRRGALTRPSVCCRCNKTPTIRRDGRSGLHGHHADYSKPFDVMWLCAPCHAAEHALLDAPPASPSPPESPPCPEGGLVLVSAVAALLPPEKP